MIDGPPFRADMHGAVHLEQPQSAMVELAATPYRCGGPWPST
jgi:hypothetical protein